ncbi:MAG: hypothetical protein SGJ21_11260 [Alphaproteobacteria bacterium]|nr:hypothetical protein [Alphaproteobacteria bacterium]
MQAGVYFSVALHIAIAAAGIVVAPTLAAEPTPMVILPVELLTISDSTNVAPVIDVQPEAEIEEFAEEMAEPEPAPAAAPAEEAPEIIPTERAPDSETAPPKSEPKPAPPKEESFDDFLESALKSVKDNKPVRAASQKTAADLRNVEDAAPRKGVGDNVRMTMTVADAIRSQLLSRGCWADQDDMPDAKRLRTVIRIRFDRDGRLMGAPELREPGRLPSGDQPMQIFVQRAQRALDMCNKPRFTVPPEYYETSPAQWIDIEFTP